MGAHTDHFMSPWLLMPALLLMFPAIWLMGIISATIAIRLDFVANLLICLSVFLLGLVTQYFTTMYLGNGFFADIISVIIPNWQYFWMADALNARIMVPYAYVLLSIIYVVAYTGIWFVWALYLFQDTELAKDSR